MEFEIPEKIFHVIPREISRAAVEPTQLVQSKLDVFYETFTFRVSPQAVFERSCGEFANELHTKSVLCPHVLPCWKVCIEIVRLLVKDPQCIGIEIRFHPGELFRTMPFELRYLPFAIPEHIL